MRPLDKENSPAAANVYIIHRQLDLANSHLQVGRLQQARKLCRTVLELQPDNLEAPYLLARIAAAEEDYAAAADLLDGIHTSGCNETFLDEYYRYHLKSGKLPRARDYFSRLVARFPADTTAWYRLAAVCCDLQDTDGFTQAVVRLYRLGASSPKVLYDLAELCDRGNQITFAERCLERCLEREPANGYYLCALANMLKRSGSADRADEFYARALATNLSPHENHSSWTNYLMNLICTTSRTPEEIFEEHRRWGKLWAEQEQPQHEQPQRGDADHRIRIGYVSADFCRHPVAFFIEPLLTMHDQTRFKIFLYANVEHEDDVTEQIKKRPCVWRPIFTKTDEEVCRLIREDGIDILVDLGGLTRKNRLPVFARKPAPLQITWLGYAHSTGLSSIDYRFTDGVADPPGMTEQLHSEELYRLPDSFLGYHPPLDPPSPAPLSCLTEGRITFAAYNNLAKTNDRLIAWWAEILKQVPHSCLALKDSCFTLDYRFREAWLDRFAALGITADRISLSGRSPTVHEHLTALGRADIALDAYPYNGTTTTCETLWMGTPVITFAGPAHVSRVSASLLTCVGAPELIARSAGEYIELAVRLANDRERLQYYRSNLRGMMQRSALMDFERFARKIEAAYLDLHQRRCPPREKE